MALLWIVAIALLAFWVFGLALDILGTLIWLFLIAGVALLVFALVRNFTGRHSA
ncbi:MAG: DUF5670 family protein [Dehalococcoidia bacterium]